jgi:oligopeptidase A
MHLHDHAYQHLSVSETLANVRKQVSIMPVPAFNRTQHSFSHIFAGGYAAGYFSYKWAEVLSADAFSAFEEIKQSETSAVSRTIGERFQKEILEMGGSRPAMLSFCAFRGREPTIDALLRHNGMINAV